MALLLTKPDSTVVDHTCIYCDHRHHDLDELRKAAKSHCPLWALWLACIHTAVHDSIDNDDIEGISIWFSGANIHLERRKQDDLDLWVFRLNGADLYNTISTSIPFGKLLPRSTSSDQTFENVKTWLQECTTKHPDCTRPLSERSSKTLDGVRFLEIKETMIMLTTRTNRAQSEGYACLSHCWGSGTDIVKTLQDNFQTHSTVGVEIDALPATFRDAVEICRKLHITYLWIDSLCIIQDNNDDWRIQAASMADIYENSRITIAASAAKNPTEGCFREIDGCYVGQAIPAYRGLYVRRELRGIDHLPLLARGWVFQEMALSPRVIHFAPDEVVWQCRFKCEPESEPNKDQKWMRRRRSYVSIRSPLKLEAEVLPRQWHDIVHSYSERALTFTKDRLPAIAAIATRIQESRPQDRYLAGLWQSSLCEDLMWSTEGLDGTGAVDDAIEQRVAFLTDPGSRIPSWSWASAQHYVNWGYRNSTVLSSVEILDIAYSVNGPDVSGEIRNAEIKLRAPLVSLDCIRNESEFRAAINLSSHDFGLGQISASHERELGIADSLDFSRVYLDDHGRMNDFLVDRDLFALFLVAHDDDFYEQALIVKEMEPGKRWIRLGVIEIVPAQNVLEKTLWEKDNDNPFPGELREEHRKRYRTMLETAETRVITLV